MKVSPKYKDYENIKDFSLLNIPDKFHEKHISELICVYCYLCSMNDQAEAYKCNNKDCALWPARKVCMKKPHNLSKEIKDKLRKQLEINRNKNHEI